MPWRLAAPALAVGLLAAAVWPFLHAGGALGAEPERLAGFFHGVLGLGAGSLVGWFSWRVVGPREARSELLGPVFTGAFLGSQAAVVLGVAVVTIVAVHATVRTRLGHRSTAMGPAGLLWPVAVLAWILGFGAIAARWWLLE